MSNIPVPSPLNLSAINIEDEWRFFRASYENYEIASGIDTKEIKQRTANLLTIVGADGFRLYNTLPLTNIDKSSIANILNALSIRWNGKRINQ